MGQAPCESLDSETNRGIMGTRCCCVVGVRQAMALIGNARQATSEGKSGPVETGLTGKAASYGPDNAGQADGRLVAVER